MGVEKPTYEELEERLAQAEKVINAVRSGDIDAIIGEDGVYMVRLKQMEEALKAERRRLETVLRQLPEGVIIAEAPSGELILGNEQVNRIWRQDFLASQSVHEYGRYKGFHPDGRPYLSHEWPLARAITKGEAIEQEEINFQRGDGSLGWMSASATPIRDEEDKVIGGVVTFSDITKRKQAEKELRAARDELELRVKERTFELESANRALEAEVAERKKIEERLRHLTSRLMEAQETERRNVALDLHDGLGGHLMAIKMALESKLEDVKKGQPASESITLKEIKGLVKGCIRELGRIQHNLRPSVLDNLGIGPALRSLCREFQNQQKNIETSWEIEIDESDVPEALKIVIYRITQEAFTNVAKHSGAENMSLSLTHRNGNIQLTIKDDGCGFDTEKAFIPDKVRQGIGLSSMEERCELLGGSFSIHSREGKGTTIHGSWAFG